MKIWEENYLGILSKNMDIGIKLKFAENSLIYGWLSAGDGWEREFCIFDFTYKLLQHKQVSKNETEVSSYFKN